MSFFAVAVVFLFSDINVFDGTKKVCIFCLEICTSGRSIFYVSPCLSFSLKYDYTELGIASVMGRGANLKRNIFLSAFTLKFPKAPAYAA